MASFGLIGHPVGHSMSKVMHERAYEVLGLDHTYGLFDVLEEDLSSFLENADYQGLNVTIPHKVNVIEGLDALTDDARILGSVNTIEFKDGKKIGHNTDVFGFEKCAENARIEVFGKNVLLLGAGGAGRAIAIKCKLEGSDVALFDMDQEKAKSLASEINAYHAKDLAEQLEKVDVVVNATPVGMHPNIDMSPIDKKMLSPHLSIIDIIYNPVNTQLMKDSQEIGCKTASGVDMLVYQGAKAFEIWTGEKAPVKEMTEAVLSNL